jgi:hypothetical protein
MHSKQQAIATQLGPLQSTDADNCLISHSAELKVRVQVHELGEPLTA